MPRRTIVKVYPQYDDKATFVESPIQRVSSPERSSTGTTLNYVDVSKLYVLNPTVQDHILMTTFSRCKQSLRLGFLAQLRINILYPRTGILGRPA